MKRILLFVTSIFICLVLFSQVRPGDAIELSDKGKDYTCNFQNAMITNFSNKSWPGFGNYKTQKIFYYCYTPPSYYSVYMIADDIEISAFHYTNYYIYDEFQNLRYFIYQSEPEGRVIIKFSGNSQEVIEMSEENILTENLFFNLESDLSKDKILEDANDNMSKCLCFFNIPNYKEQTRYIRNVFQETNSLSNLIEKKEGKVTAYYQGNKLVKIIYINDSNREYYFDNEKLIFAYYPETDSREDIRVYFYDESAYQVIYGQKYLPNGDSSFRMYSNEVKSDYNSLREIINK